MRRAHFRSATILLAILFVSVVPACAPRVINKNGKISIVGVPSDIRTITVCLTTETSFVCYELRVKDGKAGPIELGPGFAGHTYEPGKITVDAFDSGGRETNYRNKKSVEIRTTADSDSAQEVEITGDDFEKVQ